MEIGEDEEEGQERPLDGNLDIDEGSSSGDESGRPLNGDVGIDEDGSSGDERVRPLDGNLDIDEGGSTDEGGMEPMDANLDIDKGSSNGDERRRPLDGNLGIDEGSSSGDESGRPLDGDVGIDEGYREEAIGTHRQRISHFKTQASLAYKLGQMIRLDEFETAFHRCQESRTRQHPAAPLQSLESSTVSSVSLWGVSFATCPETGVVALVSTRFSPSGR